MARVSLLRLRIELVHIYVYHMSVKRRDLEKELRKRGWRLVPHGRKHDIWSDGEREEAIPRHNEINELLAQKILRKAKKK